ncbi:MAG: ABC transporter permease, partial [Paraclostridium sp.]
GVTFLVFTILHASPLDPAINILGQGATPDQIKEFNAVYGLDQPYIVQLFNSFKGLLTFDLGQSFAGNEEVFVAIARKFPVTLSVTFVSLLVAVILAIPAGIISAIKPYSAYDYTFMLIALIGLSIPNFWLGLILILKFSIEMGLLPATYVVGNASSMIMPAIVLGTSLAASIARMTRSSMLEVVKQDYMTTARAKGLSEKRVVLKHALGNAMIPIVTVIGLQFGGMLGGSAVTEKVFNINGIGSYIVDKQFIPDIPIVLAGVVYVAIIISIVNLLVDILYSFLDPRIKSKMKSY